MNSSMPNSEQMSGPHTFSTRLVVWQAVLLIGGLLAVLFCSQVLIRVNPKAATPSAKWEKRQDAAILFLGNSQHRSLDTKQFPLMTLNASIGGSDYSTHCAVLKGLAPQMPRLRLVVLGFDSLLLRTPAIERRNGDYEELLQWGVPWYSLPETDCHERLMLFLSRNPILKPVLVGPKLDQPEIAQYLSWDKLPACFARPSPSAIEVHDESPADKTVVDKAPPKRDVNTIIAPYYCAPADGKRKMTNYVNWLNQDHNVAVNRQAFLDIAAYCRKEGLSLVLLRTPTTRAFWQNRPDEWNAELDALYDEAVEAYGRAIPVWDEETPEIYEDILFDDPNHLQNDVIRTVLTPRIGDRLHEFLADANGTPSVLPPENQRQAP